MDIGADKRERGRGLVEVYVILYIWGKSVYQKGVYMGGCIQAYVNSRSLYGGMYTDKCTQ